LDGHVINGQINLNDPVSVLFSLMAQEPHTCYYTNFGITFEGVMLNDSQLFSEIENLNEGSMFVLVPLISDEQTARRHVARLRELLSFHSRLDYPSIR